MPTILSVADVRDELGLQISEDGQLEREIDRVEALYQSMTATSLGVVTDKVETFQQEYPERLLYLSSLPVTEVSEVVAWCYGEEEPDFSSDNNLDVNDYWILTDKTLGEVRTNAKRDMWKIKYSGGSASLSKDIEEALISQIKWDRTRDRTENTSLESKGMDKQNSTHRKGTYHPKFIAAVKRNRL